MLIILLHIFLIVGLIVGWIQGQTELQSSKIIYKNKSLLKYWIG
jgi:type III secretory pathway component EscS